MAGERDDALTPAQEIFARVLADAIAEDLLEERLTASTPDNVTESHADPEHAEACR